MPFLELLPFSSSLLGVAICLLGLSMITRDGVLALIALAPLLGSGIFTHLRDALCIARPPVPP
jgi:hypothetical protein